jgi:hypothetical protein
MWTTDVGEQVLDQYTPTKQLSVLFSQEPQHRDHWLRVLRYCETAKSTGEVESWLSADHDLSSSALPVMYLIQTLEHDAPTSGRRLPIVTSSSTRLGRTRCNRSLRCRITSNSVG